jgi:hypothetical protein
VGEYKWYHYKMGLPQGHMYNINGHNGYNVVAMTGKKGLCLTNNNLTLHC